MPTCAFYKVGSVKINGFHAIAWQKCRKRLPPYIEGVWDGVSCGQSRAWYWISPGIDVGAIFWIVAPKSAAAWRRIGSYRVAVDPTNDRGMCL